MLDAFVVSVVAEAARAVHVGAAEAEPVPVWVRYLTVVVVLPAS